jgi:hypothetical protein
MFRKIFFSFAVAGRLSIGLLATMALAGCYAYPAGYAPYYGNAGSGGYEPYYGYPGSGGYEGYPYYNGYAGGVFLEHGDYGHGRSGHFDGGRRDGDDQRGFHGGPSPGFSHPDARPGGFGGTFHGGGNFHGGGGGFNRH